MYTRSKRFPELFKPGAGGRWWAFIPNPAGKGRQLREPTGHTDERAAHLWYLERVRGGPADAMEAPGKTLVAALSDRIDWLVSARAGDDPTRSKLAADTVKFYTKKSKPLVNVLGHDTPLAAIGPAEIRRYILVRSKDVRATTIAKELTTLSMAWRLAKKDGLPLPAFSDLIPEGFAAKYVPKTRWLPEAEVNAFLADLAPKRRPVFAFLVATGATYPSEVTPVRKAHVVSGVVHILGTKTSTRDRYVHVPSYGRGLLSVAMKGLGPHGFEKWGNIRGDLHDAARRLGLAACSPNDLRRTFAQWLVRSGVPYELAAPMMGHGTTKMLQLVYGRRDAGAVAKLVEAALRNAPKGARQAG